ncbi:cysteine desulfurase [Paenibacillus sp. WQ 127069]|uniref:cysteine desulfurase n=2 Tax=Paenibacillus baimaensis TaxID=2982185 RepID=A0ABT2UA57_9BACL|nr:cysteine desulfurase family protein [Paenibacillus sp. WQ 127069]MCU6791510.1 cysteine desulfurase [Paenibacillus sp. WQ 127069]
MMTIYLDHAATTPVHPEVLETMLPIYTHYYGNASSTHSAGREARSVVQRSRDSIASLLGCAASQLVFTSGGTESNNMSILGATAARSSLGKHIITVQTEHHAVLHTCQYLEKLGFEVTYLPVDTNGQIEWNQLVQAIRSDTILISVMYGNNEVGTIQPIVEIGELARSKGIWFHVDAVQALGAMELSLNSLPIDLMSFSAHKIQGPKGIGALYIAKQIQLEPILHGGAQERKRRAGTENVPGIAGFAKALQIFIDHRYEMQQKMEKLRIEMITRLQEQLGTEQVVVNGHPTARLPHILNLSFPGISSETMLMNLDMEGIAAASGSACTSGSLEVSHVLQAMKLSEQVTASAVRLSFGSSSSLQDIMTCTEKIVTIVTRIRNNY